MLRILRNAALALLAAVALLAPLEGAATVYTQAVTVTSTAWVNLGAGPLAIGTNSLVGAWIVASDSAPNVSPNVAGFGTVLSQATLTPPIQTFCGVSNYWALAIAGSPSNPASTVLNVTPTNCGGGSGGASAANQTNGAQQSQVVGPTGTAAATKAASTPATQVDPALVTRNADIGTPGDAACATDTGSCDLNAFMQRLAQRLTALITTTPALNGDGGALVHITSAPAPYAFTPLSPGQHNVAITSSTGLTIPSGSKFANVCAKTASLNYTIDGTTTPTTGLGTTLAIGACVWLQGSAALANFRAISATGTYDAEFLQ